VQKLIQLETKNMIMIILFTVASVFKQFHNDNLKYVLFTFLNHKTCYTYFII
jgi:hypothetical protein